MVLPVRILGKDDGGKQLNELAHTLDITPYGARLGAIRQKLNVGEKVVLQYRQRRIQFKVVWILPMEGTREYQVGLQTITTHGDNWGLELINASDEEAAVEVAVS